jgi:hypothetical protein
MARGPRVGHPWSILYFSMGIYEIYGNLVTRATKEKYAETKEGLTEVER